MDLGNSYVGEDDDAEPVVLRDVEGEGLDVCDAFLKLLSHPLVWLKDCGGGFPQVFEGCAGEVNSLLKLAGHVLHYRHLWPISEKKCCSFKNGWRIFLFFLSPFFISHNSKNLYTKFIVTATKYYF